MLADTCSLLHNCLFTFQHDPVTVWFMPVALLNELV